MARILELYDQAAAGQIPDGGRVICVDEFGPLNLQPRPGRGWFPRGRPARRRATYTRTGGVRHMFAALDLASGQLFYRFRDRKRWQEFLGFLRQLRTRFPSGRLFVVCDNFSPHHKQQVRDWCADHDVELVFTPTNASWLNWIECEFTALRYFTLDGSDYPSHAAQEAAIAGYVRWANRRATTQAAASPSAPRSADPITYPTLLDAALASWDKELDRYWIRNNILLALNGGMLALIASGQATSLRVPPRAYWGSFSPAPGALLNRQGRFYTYRWRPVIEQYERELNARGAFRHLPLLFTGTSPHPDSASSSATW